MAEELKDMLSGENGRVDAVLLADPVSNVFQINLR